MRCSKPVTHCSGPPTRADVGIKKNMADPMRILALGCFCFFDFFIYTEITSDLCLVFIVIPV